MAPGLQITCTTHLSTLIKSPHMKKPLSRAEPGWHDHSGPMGGEHLGKTKRDKNPVRSQNIQPAAAEEQTDLTHSPEVVPVPDLQQFQALRRGSAGGLAGS